MTKKKPKSEHKKNGRPTKYKPHYCDEIIELGKQGKSRVQCATYFEVHTDTLYEWANVHSEFSEAFKKAKDFAESYWENKIHDMMESGELSQVSPTYMFYMKCRFGWRDKDPTQINLDAKTDGDVSFNFNAVEDSEFDPSEAETKEGVKN